MKTETKETKNQFEECLGLAQRFLLNTLIYSHGLVFKDYSHFPQEVLDLMEQDPDFLKTTVHQMTALVTRAIVNCKLCPNIEEATSTLLDLMALFVEMTKRELTEDEDKLRWYLYDRIALTLTTDEYFIKNYCLPEDGEQN